MRPAFTFYGVCPKEELLAYMVISFLEAPILFSMVAAPFYKKYIL